VTPNRGGGDRWGLAAGCVMVGPMQIRRSTGGSSGRGWWIGVVLALGCANEPRRFSGDGGFWSSDLGGPRDVSGDRGDDAGDLDAGRDAGRDAGPDAGRDGPSEAALDAAFDVTDAPRDVVAESAVLGCRTNADCPSPDLYCNGPGCDALGFCVPRPAAESCAPNDAAIDLVCGCDGMTYGGLCRLQLEGVRLVRFGLCPRD
jgi:Kazal-type serine protease inhibitor domain